MNPIIGFRPHAAPRRIRAVRPAAAALALLALSIVPARPAALPRSPIVLDDLAALRDVSELEMSPDGAWVAYTVRSLDLKNDRSLRDIYMTSFDGQRTIRLTFDESSDTTPRFSPDGRWIAFLSGRGGKGHTQVWLLDRQGGEAERISEFPGDVQDFVWSPDSRRLAVIAGDPEPKAGPAAPAKPGTAAKPESSLKPEAVAKPGEGMKPESAAKTSPPIVIDRLYFKEDETGYLDQRRSHLYLLDVSSRRALLLTPGPFDEALPAWSPDGSRIAFVSKRLPGPDVDRHANWDVWTIEPPAAIPDQPNPTANAGVLRQVTTNPGTDCDPQAGVRPAWSPDGKWIAYIHGGNPALIYYARNDLAVAPSDGGAARIVTTGLDRNVLTPIWSADGESILFLIEDDRGQDLASVPAAGGTIERLLTGQRAISDFRLGPGGRLAVIASDPKTPEEVYALDSTPGPGAGDSPALRPLSRQNEALLAGRSLGSTEGISVRSKDGTTVNGLIVKPPDFRAGTRYPAILMIHGGPPSQYGWPFSFQWQLLAANGYLVIAMNPRGSTGRGEAYCRAIWADWGGKDGQDVLAGVDHVVAAGLADAKRLGVGGWSYGGILTDQVIVQDTRFKAAVSGASIGNALAGYGTDQYVREYEAELGVPWKNLDVWLRNSAPLLKADHIKTPTLFICGERDFNVPLLNSEQMYQALRSLGIPTQLVIYPGQYHSIRKPSYRLDLQQRWLAWYDKYLKP